MAAPSRAMNTPRSVARTSFPCTIATSSAGSSGRLPVTSVNEAPPFLDSNTWPTPASGIQRRLNEPMLMKTCAAFSGRRRSR